MKENNNINELIARYEEMLRNGKSVYFDSDEFEEIADFYDIRENPETSLKVIEEGLKQHPGNQNLLLKKIKAFIYNEQYREALTLMIGLSFDDADSDILLLKAEIFLNTNNVQSGLSIFDLILEQTDEEFLFLEISDILKSVEMFDDASGYLIKGLEKFPKSIDIRREIADNYRLSGKYDNAIDIYNDILDIDPYSAEDWTDLGELYSLKGNYEKAIEAFDFSVTIDETDERTVYMKGNCLILNGNYEKAIETFQDYIVLNSGDETPYILIAECYEEMQQHEKAFEYCLKALEANKESILAFKKIIFFLMDREQFKDALIYANKALEISQTDSNLFFLKADILSALENYDNALENYKQALIISKEKDEKIDILYSIGVLYQKTGKNGEALLFFEQVEDFKSDYPDLFLKMAISYYETKQYDKCVEYLEKTSEESTVGQSTEDIQNKKRVINELTRLLQDPRP